MLKAAKREHGDASAKPSCLDNRNLKFNTIMADSGWSCWSGRRRSTAQASSRPKHKKAPKENWKNFNCAPDLPRLPPGWKGGPFSTWPGGYREPNRSHPHGHLTTHLDTSRKQHAILRLDGLERRQKQRANTTVGLHTE